MLTKPDTENGLWRDFHDKVWSEWIKPLLDFKSYFRQRREILLSSGSETPPIIVWLFGADWKSPLSFAIQGIFITALVVKAISASFPLVYKPPRQPVLKVAIYLDPTAEKREFPPSDLNEGGGKFIKVVQGTKTGNNIETIIYPTFRRVEESIWNFRAEQARQDISTLEKELRIIKGDASNQTFTGPLNYADRDIPLAFIYSASIVPKDLTKSEASASYESQISELRLKVSHYEFAADVEKLSEKLSEYVPAVAFLLAGYLFARLCRIGRGREAYRMRGKEHETFLYYISSRLLYFVATLYVISAIYGNLNLYAPPSFNTLVADLNNDLLSIDRKNDPWYFLTKRDTWFALVVLLTFSYGYAVIWSISWRLLPMFGMAPNHVPWKLYSGQKKIRKDIILSGMLSYVAVRLFVYGISALYALSSSVLSRFQL